MCREVMLINSKETGLNIQRLMDKNHITVKYLQEYFGFNYPQAIYKWLWGESLPSIDKLVYLSDLFQVSINDILVVNVFGGTGVVVFLCPNLIYKKETITPKYQCDNL